VNEPVRALSTADEQVGNLEDAPPFQNRSGITFFGYVARDTPSATLRS